MLERNFEHAWPQELKDAEARRYMAACRVRMLESKLDRIEPEEFDSLMRLLEAAHDEAQSAGKEVLDLKYRFYSAKGK